MQLSLQTKWDNSTVAQVVQKLLEKIFGYQPTICFKNFVIFEALVSNGSMVQLGIHDTLIYFL